MGYSTPPPAPPQPLLPLIDEEWRAVPGYEGHYEVSNWGRVRSLKACHDRPLIMKQAIQGSGYRQVMFWLNGSGKLFLVHRLVAFLFIGELPPYHEVNHKDGNRLNNRVDNLEYVTHSQNILHAVNVFGKIRGNKNHKSILNENNVRHIRALLKRGVTHKKIAAMYGVSKATIKSISQGYNWKHVQ